MVEEIPLFKIKSSLLPSLNIDSSLLGYKSPASKNLFTYEQDLLIRYTQRKEELKSLKELENQKSKAQTHDQRRSVGEEFQKMLKQTQVNIEEREKKVHSSSQVQDKIAELRRICPGIKDASEANFYLEANNFDVAKASSFYTSCTGRSNVAQSSKINLKFILPDKTEFVEQFDYNSLMWGLLEKVHLHMKVKRSFKVKVKMTGKEITFEEMTKRTFSNYGLVNNTTLSIIYE
jgi:hypothetical protein